MLSRRTVSAAIVLGLVAMGSCYGVLIGQATSNRSAMSTSESLTTTTTATMVAASMTQTSPIIATAGDVTPGSSSRASISAGANAATQCFGANHVNDSLIPRVTTMLRIAAVQPIFTATAYSDHGNGTFYEFYEKYKNATGTVTADLGLLSTNVSRGESYQSGWGLSHALYSFLSSQSAKDCGLTVGQNLRILDDIAVSQGGLFYDSNGSARFDVVIVPFSEYVTLEEYLSYLHFVSDGGTLVLVGAGNFMVRVAYNSTTGMETLVRGHGWAFNGSSAQHDVFDAWEANNTNWVGSTHTHCCFGRFFYHGATANTLNAMGKALSLEFGDRVVKEYSFGEENEVTNMTQTSVVATFANESGTLVASYVHEFRRGTVVCMCVQADLVMSISKSAQYLLMLSIISASLHTAVSCSQSPDVIGSSLSCAATLTTTEAPKGDAPAATPYYS